MVYIRWCSCVVWFLLVSIAPLLVSSSSTNNVGKVDKVAAVYAFGDSILDTGNNNYINTISKCNFPPYGTDFPGGKPTGRCSNGKLISDLFAEYVGVKPYLPPYLDPNLQAQDLITGVCFASAGSGIDPATSKITAMEGSRAAHRQRELELQLECAEQKWVGPVTTSGLSISISNQLRLFEQYIGRLRSLVGEQRSKYIMKESIYLISLANNDIGITCLLIQRKEYDLDSYATFLISQVIITLKHLYILGARKIMVISPLVVGCVPAERTIGGLQRSCMESCNELVRLYNAKLSSEIDLLNINMYGASITFIDVFTPLLDIIYNPSRHGFVNVGEGCCGTGLIETIILCNKLNPFTCNNTLDFVFWDSLHPTEKVYQIIMESCGIKDYINMSQ
ncbi:GDSL esterase/lipase At3g14820 [Linum perenne]